MIRTAADRRRTLRMGFDRLVHHATEGAYCAMLEPTSEDIMAAAGGVGMPPGWEWDNAKKQPPVRNRGSWWARLKARLALLWEAFTAAVGGD